MDYCFDLINKRFNVGKLVCEIAERVKTESTYGIQVGRLTKLSYFNGRVSVEFHTGGTSYARFHYNLANTYSENEFRELVIALGCKEEPPYWSDVDFKNYLERIVENVKGTEFTIHYNFDCLVVLGKAV